MKYSASLIARADRMFGELVRGRGCCERCGTSWGLQCAHVRRRRFKATRWTEANALALCVECHGWFDSSITDSIEWFQATFGEDRYFAMYQQSQEEPQESGEALIERLKAALHAATLPSGERVRRRPVDLAPQDGVHSHPLPSTSGFIP